MKIIDNRYMFFGIAGILILFSFVSALVFNLKLGIDMTGGVQLEYTYDGELDIDKMKTIGEEVSEQVVYNDEKAINNIDVYKVSGENILVLVAGFDNSIEAKELDKIKDDFKAKLNEVFYENGFDNSRYINIGKSFGDYIKETAYKTLIIAIIAISVYIAYSFSGAVAGIGAFWFGVIAIVTLFHDIIISSGFYIFSSFLFPEFKIDTFFVTALLTILGYSINDTIVIFDRIRANLKLYAGKKDLKDIIELSIQESYNRSIYTSLTILFVLLTIFFFGPDTIKGFVLVMIFGTLVGTYSSLFVASPLLYEMNKNAKIEKHIEKKEDDNKDDKIVV